MEREPMNVNAKNYESSLQAVTQAASVQIAARNPDRKMLTLWNHDATNFVKLYFESPTDPEANVAAFIPIAPGTGIDLKPAPMNAVRAIADTADCNVTVWEA